MTDGTKALSTALDLPSGLAVDPSGSTVVAEPPIVSPVLRQTNKGESPMAVFNGVFPILPGKEQGGRDFAAACMGERRTGFEA